MLSSDTEKKYYALKGSDTTAQCDTTDDNSNRDAHVGSVISVKDSKSSSDNITLDKSNELMGDDIDNLDFKEYSIDSNDIVMHELENDTSEAENELEINRDDAFEMEADSVSSKTADITREGLSMGISCIGDNKSKTVIDKRGTDNKALKAALPATPSFDPNKQSKTKISFDLDGGKDENTINIDGKKRVSLTIQYQDCSARQRALRKLWVKGYQRSSSLHLS